MKFHPTWPQVVLILGVLAAVGLAHAFVPSAGATIISLAGVIVGWLTPGTQKEEQK